MINSLKKWWIPLLLIIGFILSLSSPSREFSPFHVVQNVTPNSQDNLIIYEEGELGFGHTESMHSISTIELPNGDLRAVWYGGTSEGHIDVELYTSVFSINEKSWSEPESILDRYRVSADLNRYIKKLGNPVLYRHPSGVTVLFYVSVSLAGWASSQINMALSFDDGQTWHESKRLVVSPFLDMSTLIKNDVVIYEDGTMGITAYHELKGNFSQLIRVDLVGNVIDSYRISHGVDTIQPSVMVYEQNHAVALLRDMSRDVEKVRRSETWDGGKTWSEYQDLQVDNPNSAVYGFIDHKGRSWMVFNENTRQVDQPRNNIALAVSEDKGLSWRTVYYFENPAKDTSLEEKYAYPWVTTTSDHFHIFYTWNRQKFKHVMVNQTWLESLL